MDPKLGEDVGLTAACGRGYSTILTSEERIKAVALRLRAKRFPPSASTVFQTTKRVRPPINAGTSRIQNSPFPRNRITSEIQDVTGGTDM